MYVSIYGLKLRKKYGLKLRTKYNIIKSANADLQT